MTDYDMDKAGEAHWEKLRGFAFAPDKPSSGWPTGVSPISMNGLGLLGLDKDFNLYFDGQMIEIKRPLQFKWWQTLLAALTAGSAIIVAALDVARFLAEK
jgi:hypothetical protein